MNGNQFFKRLFMLGSIVIITLAVSFGPFISQLPQVNNIFSIFFPEANYNFFRYYQDCFHLKEA